MTSETAAAATPRRPAVTASTRPAGRDLERARTHAVAAWERARQLLAQAESLRAEAQRTREAVTDARRQRRDSPAGQQLLRRSGYARLLARLDTMPVIEQAKGVVMAQSGCTEAEAFDMLRRASQRSNVPVRDIAASIVARAAGQASPAGLQAPPRSTPKAS
jgi:hypothetical protein